MTRFSSIVLPHVAVERRQFAALPGVRYWPFAEDPRAVPWQPTHRIHFIGPDGQPGAVEVMWVLCQDVAWTPDGFLRRRVWYGFEREQWVPGGTTPWAFCRDSEYDGDPHRLRHTLAQGHTALEMERIGEGGGW